MRRIAVLVVSLMSCSLSQAEMRTAKQILAAIEARGASAVARELWHSGDWEKYLFPGVKSGAPDWLKVAREIRPGTDAGASSELSEALAYALLKRPVDALPVAREVWWRYGDPVCLFDYDSELPGGPRSYVRKLEAGLKRNPCTESCELRAECLANLTKSKRLIERGGK